MLYGLATDAVIIIDTRAKAVVGRIDLASGSFDLDIARDGSRGVVANRVTGSLTVIDLELRTIAKSFSAVTPPGAVEVTRSGVAFYASFDQHTEIHRVDLTTEDDTELQRLVHYQADMELADDDIRLYVADSALSAGHVAVYDTTDGVWGLLDSSTISLVTLKRHVLLGPSGRVYYAEHQFGSANDLGFITGGSREQILDENSSGTLAVGTSRLWDAALMRPVAQLPETLRAAAFAAAGQELWTQDVASDGLHFMGTSELVGATELGVREVAPGPLSSYTLDQLVADPVRDLLYARSHSANVVLAIDRATLQPIRELRVGSEPSDIAVAADGGVLYVGHQDMSGVAVIDLTSLVVDRFVKVPAMPYEIETAGTNRLVYTSRSYTTALFDIATKATYALPAQPDYGALATTPDGTTLFIGESGSSSCHLYRFTISGTTVTAAGTTDMNGAAGFNNPPRVIATNPSGTTVFYGGTAFDAGALPATRYSASSHVRVVSPDGRVGLSSTHVIDVATGESLGVLPVSGTAIAIEPTSHTAYVASSGTITAIDLDGYAP